MFKLSSLLVGLVCVGVVGCGSSDEGTFSMSLVAVGIADAPYRLSNAKLDVLDRSGQPVATLQPGQGAERVSVPLAPGDYAVVLRDGWVLQRRGGDDWRDMTAVLADSPRLAFAIAPQQVTELAYHFSVGATEVAAVGARAALAREFAVNECGLYAGKISSLAAFTVDCVGKLDNTQYRMLNGVLARTFSSCSSGDSAALASIDGILSLQSDRPELEAQFAEAAKDVRLHKGFSSRCIAREWAHWSERFTVRGAGACPNWKRINASAPSFADIAAGGTQKLDFVYEVSFPDGAATASCGTPAECAVACAAGFTGFVLSTDGPNRVTADPPYWEVGNSYTPPLNPFLSPGYWHDMVHYGPIPGDQFGHAQRARAYRDSSGNWVGEACSYYSGGTSFLTTLILNENITGAVSWCKSPF